MGRAAGVLLAEATTVYGKDGTASVTVALTNTAQQPAPAPAPRAAAPLSTADNRAVDRADERLAGFCDAVANGRATTESDVRDLVSRLDAMFAIARRSPRAIFRPPLRPERERSVRTAAREAIEVLRTGDCLPGTIVDTLQKSLG